MHYRDRVALDGQPHRANVWVLSATSLMAGQTDRIDRNVMTVSIPATPPPPDNPAKLAWRGREYNVQGRPMPIMALGRLDHWEVNAVGVEVA